MNNSESVQAIHDAFGRGDVAAILDPADGKVSRFFHCIDRHAFVLAYGL